MEVQTAFSMYTTATGEGGGGGEKRITKKKPK